MGKNILSFFQDKHQPNQPDKNECEDYNKWHQKVHGDEKAEEIYLSQWHETTMMLLSSSLKDIKAKNTKVLEVGCGVGDFTIYLAKQQIDVTAVDFSSKAIELARQKAKVQNQNIDFQIGNAQKLEFKDNSFDLLISCECLEHIPEPYLAIREFYRVLKPSGKLVITTENYSNAMLLYWLACWVRKEPFNSGEQVQPIEHFFVYWRVKRMLNLAGFEVKKMIGSHHVFLLLPRFHPSTFVKERFTNPFFAKLFLPFARHIAFEAVKK